MAIFAPDSSPAASQALWISRQHSIPVLLAQWGHVKNLSELDYAVNLHPDCDAFGSAMLEFLYNAEQWEELGLIYFHDDSKLICSLGICFKFFIEPYFLYATSSNWSIIQF